MSDRTLGPLGPAWRSTEDILGTMSKAFESAMQEQFAMTPTPDPVLVALFHAFALHINEIYVEAESSFPRAVLDDLLSGLSLAPRVAQPAQTVVQFSQIDARATITTDTTVSGPNGTGEVMVFSVDHPIEISRARLVFSGIVSGNTCHMVAGATAPADGAQIRTRDFRVEGTSEVYSSLFLAIEADAQHLSNLGVMLQVSAYNSDAGDRISRAPWTILSPDGARHEAGIMRSEGAAGGVRRLHFVDAGETAASIAGDGSPRGPYGNAITIFPVVPAERRWSGAPPKALRPGLTTIVQDRPDAYMAANLVWIEILLPPGNSEAATLLERIALNCVTASNLEDQSTILEFVKFGSNIRTQPEGLKSRHLLGVVSVSGEFGHPYVAAESIDAPLNAGRYRIRQQSFEARPRRSETGTLDRTAQVRLRFCDGVRANDIPMHRLHRLNRAVPDNPRVQVTNIVPTRAGADPPAYAEAKVRFADLVRSRERIVTAEDITLAVRACDSRARDVSVRSTPRVQDGVLTYVDDVVVAVAAAAATDPERVALADRLRTHLASRWMIGREVTVTVVTMPGSSS